MEDDITAPTLTENLLPALLEDVDITLEAPLDIKATASLEDLKEADVAVANDVLRICYAGFGKATSISSLCKLMAQSLSAVEHRRKILCKPYGVESKVSKNEYYEPLP